MPSSIANHHHHGIGIGYGYGYKYDEAAAAASIPVFPIACMRARQHPYGLFYDGSGEEHPFMRIRSFSHVLLQISFVILITRIFRFLLKPLKQPKVVSEVIGGLFIGPSVLGRNKTFKEYIFRDDTNFLVRNIGMLGFMYFLFISGVKMDMSVLMKRSKKHLWIALLGMTIPFIAVTAVGFCMRKSMDHDLSRISSIGSVSSSMAITCFPVLYTILKELNLLSSEVGRTALSAAVVGDAIGINMVVVFEAALQAEEQAIDALWYTVSLIGLGVFMVVAVRPLMAWIIHKTPQGTPVDQSYITSILLGVLVMGFLTDFFGIAIANGPLWLGLIIPDGPPLGATLVERSESFIMEVLMPCAFAYVGLFVDVFEMARVWPSLRPLLSMALTGYFTKLGATLVAAFFFRLSLRDSLTLSLIMSFRGQVDYVLYVHWMDKKIIGQPSFALMVVLSTAVTAVATTFLHILYDPTKPYIINKRRTIQHTPPDTQLRIVLCIHDEDNVPAMINLLEVSNPTLRSPFLVYALHLKELLGRASPILIDHALEYDQQECSLKYSGYYKDTIHKMLMAYCESSRRGEHIHFHEFTAVAPKRTMYQDICELALINKATLIIITFHKECLCLLLERDRETQTQTPANNGIEIIRHGVHSINAKILENAPCSVGILVDKGRFRLLRNNLTSTTSTSRLKIAVLFLGGGDAREALIYADRMAGYPNVCVTVIRFLAHDCEGENEREKKLDDGVVMWFWVKHERNDGVTYREVVVKNGEETASAIQAMNRSSSSYDLWIVGRKQGINPVLLEGLSTWGEHTNELGVIGDYVSSIDFGSRASVLVVQQQILREQRNSGWLRRLVATARKH